MSTARVMGAHWGTVCCVVTLVLLVSSKLAFARNVAMTMSVEQPRFITGRLLAADPSDACITSPKNATCAAYVYPEARAAADVADLCKNMPFMPGCAVYNACKQPQGAPAVSRDPKDCSSFQLLVTICKHDDMSGMGGCKSFNTLCAEGSVVKQCQDYPGMPHLITSADANRQVKSICTEMTMDGCEKCMPSWTEGRKWSNCSLLDVYGQLCFDMPDMAQCSNMKQMCSVDPSLYPCCGLLPGSPRWGGQCGAKGEVAGPSMKMYFFNGFPFYLLFQSWTPSTAGQYAGAWFAIFFMAIVYEALQVIRYRAEIAVMAKDAQDLANARSNGGTAAGVTPTTNGSACCGDVLIAAGADSVSEKQQQQQVPRASVTDSTLSMLNGKPSKPTTGNWLRSYRLQPQQVAVDVLRAVLQLLVVGLAYLLMLAAMSFNVGIFFAVIGGITVGSFIFSRFKHYTVLNPDVCCGV